MSESIEVKLARIDENVQLLRDDLLGAPGQQGRVPKLESDVEDLEAHKNRAVGIAIAWGSIVTLLGAAWHYMVHGSK